MDWDTPTVQVHKNLQVLKVSDIFKSKLVQTVYKSVNKMLPDIFHDYFTKRSAIHQHNTINCRLHKLNVPRTRTNIGSSTLRVQGAIYYNQLPLDVIIKPTYKSFAKAVHNHFLQSYN